MVQLILDLLKSIKGRTMNTICNVHESWQRPVCSSDLKAVNSETIVPHQEELQRHWNQHATKLWLDNEMKIFSFILEIQTSNLVSYF